MYYYYYHYLGSGNYRSLIVLIPAMILAFIAEIKVKTAYSRYSDVENSRHLTGANAARKMLDANGLSGVPINVLQGVEDIKNYFDPRSNTINLSEAIYQADSVAAMCIACHEAGHAIQYATNYAPLRIRNGIVPAVNFASKISWVLIMLGLIFSTSSQYGSILFNIGALCFASVVLFYLITLPVELDASRRALSQMSDLGMVNDADYSGSQKVLRAAAMTYVAALATAVVSLLRVLLIRGNND